MAIENATDWISPDCAVKCPFFIVCDAVERILYQAPQEFFGEEPFSASLENYGTLQDMKDHLEQAGISGSELEQTVEARSEAMERYKAATELQNITLESENSRRMSENKQLKNRLDIERHNVGATCSTNQPKIRRTGTFECNSALGRRALKDPDFEAVLKIIGTIRAVKL